MNESVTFTLPVSKQEVIIRGYVTGAIDREVKRIAANANRVRFETDAANLSDADVSKLDENSFPPGTKIVLEPDTDAPFKAEDKLLELMVTALDGSTGDVYNRVMQLPAADVQFITDKVNEVRKSANVEAGDPKAPTSTATNSGAPTSGA